MGEARRLGTFQRVGCFSAVHSIIFVAQRSKNDESTLRSMSPEQARLQKTLETDDSGINNSLHRNYGFVHSMQAATKRAILE